MPTSVRLDPETEALLRRLARARGRSKSEIIRDALHRLATVPSDVAKPSSLYQAVDDLVGIAGDGPEDLAEQHKRRLRDKLRRRR